MQKIVVVWSLLSLVVLAGCWTSSKVEQFLSSYESSDSIQKPIENFSGTSSVADDLFIYGALQEKTNYGLYTDYNKNELVQALESWKRVVLTSYSEDCDICGWLDESLAKSLSRIPEDVVIMKIPFDEWQRTYDITEQNSVIYLNTDGSVRYMSDGGIDSIDSLVNYL